MDKGGGEDALIGTLAPEAAIVELWINVTESVVPRGALALVLALACLVGREGTAASEARLTLAVCQWWSHVSRDRFDD